LVDIKTEDEAQEVLKEMPAALTAGTERVEAEILSQMKSWTLAGLEDRAIEDQGM
jgi:hypothetical protein